LIRNPPELEPLAKNILELNELDRYKILLGKRLEPQKGYWNTNDEHSWNYAHRLRLLVTGGMGGGKTSYLIYDARHHQFNVVRAG
jgi:hypothetical protein